MNLKSFFQFSIIQLSTLRGVENQGSIHNSILILGFSNSLDFYDVITVLVLW